MRETGVSPTTSSIAEAIPGEACEAIAYHGWGYDRHFWQPWETLLAQQHIALKCFDRGYFGQPVQPTFSHATGRKLILAHSYGLHLCPPEQLQVADAVVVFASFVQFHPQEARARRRSQRILQQMIDQCRLDPESVLRAFWETCGHGLKLREQTICEQAIGEQATPLLVEDLVALGRSQMNLEDWMRSPQSSPLIILIQGNQDHIVPWDRAPDLLEFWANPNATLIQMDGPHALPATQPQHCWDACWALLQPVIKPAFKTAPKSATIAQAFGQAADTYDRHGTAQRACADHLLAFVPTGLLDHLPLGPVLEFGCGTGFLTQGLIARLGRTHDLEITDLSAAMLARCQEQVAARSIAAPLHPLPRPQPRSPQFYTLDAEAIPTTASPYALIASNFALQWFQTPEASVLRLLRSLLPGGWLLLSFPSDRSFPQWRSLCAQLGLPRPGNALPEPEPLIEALRSRSRQCLVQEHDLPLQFDSALDFLKHFRAIGAATRLAGARPNPVQLRQLITTWDRQSPNGITVDYHAICLAVQK